jgi:hypothetical protein
MFSEVQQDWHTSVRILSEMLQFIDRRGLLTHWQLPKFVVPGRNPTHQNVEQLISTCALLTLPLI